MLSLTAQAVGRTAWRHGMAGVCILLSGAGTEGLHNLFSLSISEGLPGHFSTSLRKMHTWRNGEFCTCVFAMVERIPCRGPINGVWKNLKPGFHPGAKPVTVTCAARSPPAGPPRRVGLGQRACFHVRSPQTPLACRFW